MAYTDFDNLWTLMSQYRFIPDSDCIQDDLTCLICKKLMIDSFQSGCGCQYCYKCIQGYLGGESKYCTGNKDECKEECLLLDVNVLRSAMLNRKLSKLKVRCPNESCQYVEELSRMEDHLRLCMKQKMDCPYVVLGCNDGGKHKEEISTHLSQYTLDHTHLLLEYIQKIENEVSTLKEESKKNIENIVNLNRELVITKSLITSLKEDLRDKGNIMLELLKEVRHLKDDLEKSKLEMVSLKESKAEDIKIKEFKNEIELLKQDSINKESNIKDLQKKMIAIKKEVMNGNEDSKDMKDELETLKKESDTHRQGILSRLKDLKNGFDKEMREVKEQVLTLETEFNNDRKRSSDIQYEVETLKKENEKYRHKITSEFDTMREESKKRESELVIMREESKKRESGLDTMREEPKKRESGLDTMREEPKEREIEEMMERNVNKSMKDSNERIYGLNEPLAKVNPRPQTSTDSTSTKTYPSYRKKELRKSHSLKIFSGHRLHGIKSVSRSDPSSKEDIVTELTKL